MDPLLFSPRHLKQLCEQYHISPSKTYGQHFLISEAPIRAMLAAAALRPTDTVIEIGPGFGCLTFGLAERVKKIIAFEIERSLEPYWDDCLAARRAEKHGGEIEIVWGNALRRIPLYISTLRRYVVVANLPYQITSQVFRSFLEATNQPERMVVMVQKEVAERITAGKGDMNLLGLSVQYYGEPRVVSRVPKGAFWPQPKVDSAVIAIDNIQKQAYDTAFFQYARAGFANKRKQLWRNIATALHMPEEMVKAAVRAVAGDERARAQDLSKDEWVELAAQLTK